MQYPYLSLGVTARSGLTELIKRIAADAEITNICWAAYMLATVKHECADRWMPVEENGKGTAHKSNGDYGSTIKIVDPAKKLELQNVYYGRGYVQLTWDYNYQKLDKVFNLSGSESLYLYPNNALRSDLAYKIMSHGMRNGTFTGKKLSDYIFSTHVDYRGARRIINGDDMARVIAAYADDIEFLLRFCNRG